MTKEQIERNFTYHKPFGDQPQRYEQLRSVGKVLATEIQRDCPESREKSLAFTHLEQAIMWANAAIARNESDFGPDAYGPKDGVLCRNKD